MTPKKSHEYTEINRLYIHHQLEILRAAIPSTFITRTISISD